MQSRIARRVFDLIYPLFFYYIMYYCLQVLFASFLVDSFGSLFCLLLAAICCIPFQIFFYRRAIVIRNTRWPIGKEWLECIFWIVAIVGIGAGCNVLVSHMPLQDISQGYESSTAILRDGSFMIRILTNAIAVPILEEVIYRGIICGQIEAWGSVGSMAYKKPDKPAMTYVVFAVLCSAILFGALHFNVVQFLYAGIMGIFLGIAYVRTHRLWVVILAHGCTNLLVILMTLS